MARPAGGRGDASFHQLGMEYCVVAALVSPGVRVERPPLRARHATSRRARGYRTSDVERAARTGPSNPMLAILRRRPEHHRADRSSLRPRRRIRVSSHVARLYFRTPHRVGLRHPGRTSRGRRRSCDGVPVRETRVGARRRKLPSPACADLERVQGRPLAQYQGVSPKVHQLTQA